MPDADVTITGGNPARDYAAGRGTPGGYDVAVVGGGPAGYAAALRAAALGLDVVLIERAEVGGTCLNRGCVPTKALLESARLFRLAARLGEFGVTVEAPRLDWLRVRERQGAIVSWLRQGLVGLLEARGVQSIRGSARLIGPCELEIVENGERLKAKTLILAPGSAPVPLSVLPVDHETILDSTDALSLPQVPDSLLVVGGGVIGLEFASAFAQLGAHVTVVEALDRLLPGEDAEASAALRLALESMGVAVHCPCRVTGVVNRADRVLTVRAEAPAGELTLTAEKVLVAVGRAPAGDGLGLAAAGIPVERGRIQVDGAMETSVPGVFAAGDVTGRHLLAHAAFWQGFVAAESAYARLSGRAPTPPQRRVVPRCVFTTPEVAAAGLTEEAARAACGQVRVGRAPFSGVARALVLGEASGFVKVVLDGAGERLLGVSIVGPDACELIAPAVLALDLECSGEELSGGIVAHPTLSEAVREACLAALGKPLHVPPTVGHTVGR